MADTNGSPIQPMDLIPKWEDARRPTATLDDDDDGDGEPFLLDGPDELDGDDEDDPIVLDPAALKAFYGDRLQVLDDITQSALMEAPILSDYSPRLYRPVDPR